MPLFSGGGESSRRKGVKKAPGGEAPNIDWAALSQQTGFTDAVSAAMDALQSAAAAATDGGSPNRRGKAKGRLSAAGMERDGASAITNIIRTLSRAFFSLSPSAQRNALWGLLVVSILYIPGLWTLKVALAAALLLFRPLDGASGLSGGKRGGAWKVPKQKDAKGQWFSTDPLVAAMQRIPETTTYGNIGSPDPSSSSPDLPAFAAPPSPSPELAPRPQASPSPRPHAIPPPPLPASVTLPDSALFSPQLPPSSPRPMVPSLSEPQLLSATPRMPSQLNRPVRHPLESIVGRQQATSSPRPDPHVTSSEIMPNPHDRSRARHVSSPYHSTDSPSVDRRTHRLPSLPPSLPPPPGNDERGPHVTSGEWQRGPSGSFHRIAVAKKAWKRTFSGPSKPSKQTEREEERERLRTEQEYEFERAMRTKVFDEDRADTAEGGWVDEFGRPMSG